jgi:hypothetical protein
MYWKERQVGREPCLIEERMESRTIMNEPALLSKLFDCIETISKLRIAPKLDRKLDQARSILIGAI